MPPIRAFPMTPEQLAAVVARARGRAAKDVARPRAGRPPECTRPDEVPAPEIAVAMALAELGQYDQATQWQRGAIDAAMKQGRTELGERMAANLRLYESHTPCRTPWRDDEPAQQAAN